MYEVIIKKKVNRGLRYLPPQVVQKFAFLVRDLEANGPVQPSWPNYSDLGGNNYHCHLSYHYVACWHCENVKVTIEVYYVGSREGTPY